MLLGGCGSADDAAVVAAAESFGAAVAASDFAAACELLAPPLTPITDVSVASGAAQVRSDGTATFFVVDAGRWRVLATGCQEAGPERPYECTVSKR